MNVLRMSDCRLAKLVMLEALEMRGRIEWVRDLQRSVNDFGWGNVNVEDLGRKQGRLDRCYMTVL